MLFDPTGVTWVRQGPCELTPSADDGGPPPRTPPTVVLLALGMGDPTPAVRRHVLRQLGNLGPAALGALPAVVKACGDPDEGVRGEASQALDRIMRTTSAGAAQGKWRRFLTAALRALGWPAA